MNKKALKISIIVIATLAVVTSIIYLGISLGSGRFHAFDEVKVEYVNAHKPIYADDMVDESGNRTLLINPQLTDTLEIEYASMTFEKITTLEARKQNGKNVIRNMKNGLTYRVMLYVQFVGEDEGRYYDFVVYETAKPSATYYLRVSFINEALDLNQDIEMRFRVRSDSLVWLNWENESTATSGSIYLSAE